MDEEVGIMDWGLASENKTKIIQFLDKIYNISFDNAKEWESEIFNFFREELIVPYIIRSCTKEDDSEFFECIKQTFLGKIIIGGTIIWDSSECYKELIKIRDSLKAGMHIKEYLVYLFLQNHIIRQMFIKNVDENDSRFKNFGLGIKPVCYEIKDKDNKIILYETTYFILPDKDVKYPIKKWVKKITEDWREKLKRKINGKPKLNNKRNPIDSRLRHECFKRDNYKCVECGGTNKDKILHADHILPVSQGGKDELDNLQTLCSECNLAKSNKNWKGGKNE